MGGGGSAPIPRLEIPRRQRPRSPSPWQLQGESRRTPPCSGVLPPALPRTARVPPIPASSSIRQYFSRALWLPAGQLLREHRVSRGWNGKEVSVRSCRAGPPLPRPALPERSSRRGEGATQAVPARPSCAGAGEQRPSRRARGSPESSSRAIPAAAAAGRAGRGRGLCLCRGGRFAEEGPPPPPPGAAGRGKAGSGAAVAAAEGRGLGRVRRRAEEEKEREAGGASRPLSEDAARIRPGKGRGKRRGSERAPPPRRQRSGARLGWEPPRRRHPPRSAPRRPAGGIASLDGNTSGWQLCACYAWGKSPGFLKAHCL
ncbi:cytoplasmic protein NCK2 isoform X2 [Agelaius tricolor]|uniref:cytoplasmic protein NCK2 isoform X2 n=1 Tax=Agelaius tricolor TaxID=9191 RepID=UPI0039F17286